MEIKVSKISKKCFHNLLRIQAEETSRGIDLCHVKLRELWLDGAELPVVEDYNGFVEPSYPYGIYLYGDGGEGAELVISRDGEAFTFIVTVEK